MQNTKGKAIASLVCGIVGLACVWFGYLSLLGLAAGIVGIVLGVQVRKCNDENKNMATAGLVLGIIAVVLGAVMFSCVICAACVLVSSAGSLAAYGL